MMEVRVPKKELMRGTTCRACKEALSPTDLYAVRCPKCGQLHQAEAS